VLFILINH